MFCSKCGKEIDEGAAFCSSCGCATGSGQTQTNVSNGNGYSGDYVAIKEFEEKVRTMHVLGIISLVLCLGIGGIFSIISWIYAKSFSIPKITTTNPSEVAMYEAAKRKLKSALNFAMIPLFVLIFSCVFLISPAIMTQDFTILFIFGAMILIMFAIGVPCTKHLNDELYKKDK